MYVNQCRLQRILTRKEATPKRFPLGKNQNNYYAMLQAAGCLISEEQDSGRGTRVTDSDLSPHNPQTTVSTAYSPTTEETDQEQESNYLAEKEKTEKQKGFRKRRRLEADDHMYWMWVLYEGSHQEGSQKERKDTSQ